MESLHDSQQGFVVYQCGHAGHNKCLVKALRKGDYRCPHCRKCMTNMESEWAMLRASIAQCPIPQDWIAIRVGDVVSTAFGEAVVEEIKSLSDSDQRETLTGPPELIFSVRLTSWSLANGGDARAFLNRGAVVANAQVSILCNDCGDRSLVDFHVIGLECKPCGSFNTSRL